MTVGGVDPALRRRVLEGAPDGWDRFLQRVPAAELAAGSRWTELAARHYPHARPRWLVAETRDGDLLGGLPLLVQRRCGFTRLESSFDGAVTGPQIAADLPPELQDRVFSDLCLALASMVKGGTVLAAVTVADQEARRRLAGMPQRRGWALQAFRSAVVDCRPGPARIESEAWTKNRRNERNRGLRRGCTLQRENDSAALERWYPIYLRQAGQWAQAPVPLGFLVDFLREDPAKVVLNTVRLRGDIVGAHYCFISRNRLVPFLSGAVSSLQGTHFINTLLYWQDILYACEAGLDAVDFGGCVGRDSLWDFKRRCGGVPEERLQWQVRSLAGCCLVAAAAAIRIARGRGS